MWRNSYRKTDSDQFYGVILNNEVINIGPNPLL